MDTIFSPNTTQPNRPLRKPSSGPTAPSSSFTRPEFTTISVAPGAILHGPITTPLLKDKSKVMGFTTPPLTVHFCNYCGKQGNFRCKRCKKMSYCSVLCQTEDWKAHRHVCKAIEPEPVKEKLMEIITARHVEDKDTLAEVKASNSSGPRKVSMNDLCITKAIEGAEIQASVIEFYHPGKFFLIAQNPELPKALQKISTELQKTCSVLSAIPYVPSVGEVCAVQFSCDMNWYRGLVQTLAADQKMANILYIDFGNEEDVPVDRIRPLPANIHPFSPCAMKCRIAHVVPVVGSWSDKCCIAARQLLASKIVTVKLVKTQDTSHIHAVDILLSVGKYLSTFLLEQGYAVKETTSLAQTEKNISAMLNASLENFRCLSDGKDENTWAQPPEPIIQAVGDQLSVVVTHLQSPNQIIVQKIENVGVLQDLQLKLREHCSKVPVPQNFRPGPGTVCCAQFSEDKQWYRAEILAYPSEKRVCVGYLDFGNSEEVDLCQLRPISASLLALPMQAIPCGLKGVQPLGEKWSEDCLLALQRQVLGRTLRIDIQGAHEGKALVTMIDEASDPQANVAELLISAGYAAPIPVATSVDQQASEAATTPEPHVSCPECEPLVWSTTELPCDGHTVALRVSFVESPGKFYCRINNPTDHQRLIELQAQLKEHCETNKSPFIPKVGEPCCAKFPDDGSWYRALVKELFEDEATVNFVEYGYSMTVKTSHLCSITRKLLKFPFQAVPCWLTGVEPLGSEWSSEALLWFQTLVDGEQLNALVVSVTDQGYGVELESRGQNVAAALISEQLAKVSGEMSKEMHGKLGSMTKQLEVAIENRQNRLHVQASDKVEIISREVTSEEQTAVQSDVASFPVDWKTVELPLNETFQPYVAAVISPSLFYLFGVTQVDQQKLQEVMMELAASCNNSTLSADGKCKLVPGAACCAQFSADNNWYRAVVLEVGENDLSVIYADYGNSENVPFSRILSIPMHLLQLPFQITRCTLTGKEHFPAEWPAEVQQMFRSELVNGVLATVQAFDGSANVLSLTLPVERGGGHLTAMILDALNAYTNNLDTATRTDIPGSTPICSAAEPAPQPPPVPDFQNDLENKTVTVNTSGPNQAPEPTTQRPQQMFSTSPATANEDPMQKVVDQMAPPCQNNTYNNDPQTSSCCCQSIKTKIDKLEQMMQLQIALLKKFVGESK